MNLTTEQYKEWAAELDLLDRVPVITITGGFARKTAEDERGNAFIEFEEEYGPPETFFVNDGLRIQKGSRSKASEEILEHYDELYSPQDCAVCGEPVDKGWLCLDGGEVYHYGCVADETYDYEVELTIPCRARCSCNL